MEGGRIMLKGSLMRLLGLRQQIKAYLSKQIYEADKSNAFIWFHRHAPSASNYFPVWSKTDI